jgi:trehalose 2-sulfotransferase
MSRNFDHLFIRTTLDPDRRAKFAALPLPTHRLVIYFTPRSGSSWLTDIIVQSGRLGAGNEIFNPNFVHNIANGIQSLGREDYMEQVQRRFRSGNGRFSFEITSHQLDRLFPDPSPFMAAFNTPDCRAVWLIRQDIVAQAVSLAKMVTTQISHTPHATEQERERADLTFSYDYDLIKRWLLHILTAERRSEELFSLNGIEPFRVSYEDMIAAGAALMRVKIAALLDVQDTKWTPLTPKHEKLGTQQNDEFAARFRAEDTALIAEIESERTAMLGRLSVIEK